MATEKRLIDANALLAEFDKFANPMPNKSGYDFLCGIATAITEIEDAPTIDAVEVVRCKDCKRWSYIPELDKVPHCTLFCGLRSKAYPTKPDDFCSMGERRTDNGC